MGKVSNFVKGVDTPGGHLLVVVGLLLVVPFLPGIDGDKYFAELVGAVLVLVNAKRMMAKPHIPPPTLKDGD